MKNIKFSEVEVGQEFGSGDVVYVKTKRTIKNKRPTNCTPLTGGYNRRKFAPDSIMVEVD